MTSDALAAVLGVATNGSLFPGDTLYVSPGLYARLTTQQRAWLWAFALERRAHLVTDLAVGPPITVRRAAQDAAVLQTTAEGR
ncbi:MAG: hypothetical protein ACJ8AO_20300 [Gemmatimonadaceae bacterium]